jgi:hypothetical protein
MFSEALRNKLDIVGSDSERQTRQAGNIVIDFHRRRSVRYEQEYVL